jgi:ribosome modulation factor
MNMAISAKQWHTIKAIRDLAGKSKTITRDMLVRAHKIGYPNLANADSKTVAAYISVNLRSAAFLKAFEPFTVQSNQQHG